ncbi:hypothetical protein AAG906_032050 [Vitis piasezkii]
MYSRSTTLYVFGVIFFPFCEKGKRSTAYISLRGHPFSVAQIKVKLRSYFALAFAGVLTGQLSEYSLNLSWSELKAIKQLFFSGSARESCEISVWRDRKFLFTQAFWEGLGFPFLMTLFG